MSKEFLELTKNDFVAYEIVRKSGEYSMIMEATSAMQRTGLDRRTYHGVQQHYNKLKEKYGK